MPRGLVCIFLITSTEEVMVYPTFVFCLSVYLSVSGITREVVDEF